MNAPSSSSGPALPPVPRPVSSEMVDVGRELSPPSSDENNNERPLAFFETLFRDENGFKPPSVANIHMKVKSTYTEWTKGPFKLNWDEMEFLRTCILKKYWSQVKMEDWKLLENALKGRMILLEEDRLRRCRPRDARWAIKALRDSGSKIDGKVPRARVSNNEEAAAVDFDNPQLEPDIENRVNASLANDGLVAKSAESNIVKSSNEKKFSDLRNGESKRAHDYDLRKDKVEADFKTAAFIVMQKREMSLQLGRGQNDESLQLGEVNSKVVAQDPGPVEKNNTDLVHKKHDTKQPSLSVKKGQAVVAAKSKVKYLWTTRKEDQINLTLDEDLGKYTVSKPRKICLLIKDKIVELEDYHKYMQESDFIIPQDPDDRTDMPPLPKPKEEFEDMKACGCFKQLSLPEHQ
ncbi:unnamed protein product [Orchesella dallaii]